MCKMLIVILLIVTMSPFARVQAAAEPNLISMLGNLFASSTRYLTKTIGNVLNIQNPITPTLCGLRTVTSHDFYMMLIVWIKLKFISEWANWTLWIWGWRASCDYRRWIHFDGFSMQFKAICRQAKKDSYSTARSIVIIRWLLCQHSPTVIVYENCCFFNLKFFLTLMCIRLF